MDSVSASSPCHTEQGDLTANEKIAFFFQPDALLPEQYFNNRGKKTILEPEKKLMLAILEDAVNCFQDNHSARCGKGKRLFNETQEWICGVSDWVFAFENICSALGFNPEYIRKGLMQWRQKELTKRRTDVFWKGGNVF